MLVHWIPAFAGMTITLFSRSPYLVQGHVKDARQHDRSKRPSAALSAAACRRFVSAMSLLAEVGAKGVPGKLA